jgi:hypothetical protein
MLNEYVAYAGLGLLYSVLPEIAFGIREMQI